MSQNARDLYSRFSHLLQPIRDLTKNWDVDVASQLEEYMEEVRREEWREKQGWRARGTGMGGMARGRWTRGGGGGGRDSMGQREGGRGG
jgi:hypothetical protein